MSSDHTDQTARFWNERHKDPAGEAHDNFLSHPMIQTYISLRAFGTMVSQMDTLALEIERRTDPGDRIVSVGCGRADKERFFAARLPDREFVAVDLANEIVEIARTANREAGVTNLEVRVGNFNDLDLEPDTYALALGLGAIHHVEQLETFWDRVGACLKPGGVVVAQEFIGANRLQWTEAQLEHCARALRDIVPPRHKPHHDVVVRPSLETMLATDPSEAIRSAEILPTCRDAGWRIDGYCSGGGALLQPILMYQISTYDHRDWGHNLVLSQLFAEEDRLMREGVLTDDFAMWISIPPKSLSFPPR